MSKNKSPRYISNLTRNTLALIMAGGRGERLKHLTMWRAKPAVPFGVNSVLLIFPYQTVLTQGFVELVC